MRRPQATRNKRPYIIGMIPARVGSTRLAVKNLALLNGKPLIYYAIKAAKDSNLFDRIMINSESELFKTIARRYGVGFYRRPEGLAASKAKSDSVVYDFLENNPCDIVVWVNSIAPLQTGAEIREVVDYFIKEGLDSLITVKNEHVHTLCGGKAVNFKKDELFAQTQDLEPVQPFVYSIMMWRSDIFKKTFERLGYAIFCGKGGVYPVSRLSSAIIIKREGDLMLAEALIRQAGKKRYKVRYDPVLKGAHIERKG